MDVRPAWQSGVSACFFCHALSRYYEYYTTEFNGESLLPPYCHGNTMIVNRVIEYCYR